MFIRVGGVFAPGLSQSSGSGTRLQEPLLLFAAIIVIVARTVYIAGASRRKQVASQQANRLQAGSQSRERLQIEDANLHTVSTRVAASASVTVCLSLINSSKFTGKLPANKVNNVWQLSRLSDPPEMQPPCAAARSSSGLYIDILFSSFGDSRISRSIPFFHR